jgi:hypothetical protein
LRTSRNRIYEKYTGMRNLKLLLFYNDTGIIL